jgi:hypothetical protein
LVATIWLWARLFSTQQLSVSLSHTVYDWFSTSRVERVGNHVFVVNGG